jgi:Putative auto-transporter adhesin, head GIN domain
MRGRRFVFGVAVVMSLLAVTGCDDIVGGAVGVRGSGKTVTESRDVSGFDEIAVLGSGVVVVTVDGTESLVVEAEDNIMPLLRTEVRNGRLELGPKQSISPTEEIRYTISAASLEGVSISGSGDISATGVDSKSFSVAITGSGHIVPTGTTGDLAVDISGSGNFEGAGLEARIGEVTISGSGSAAVNVTDTLDVTIAGSGGVSYSGTPSLTTSISGSGDVTRR